MTKTLETPRLLLRRFEMSDDEAMLRNWASDPEVAKYLTWQPHESIDVTRAVLKEWVSSYDKDESYYHWVIVLKALGEPIGSIGAVQRRDDIGMVHVGYCIGRKWWRQGITSEALAALIKYFFEEAGVNRVESRHDPRNPNSGKVMLKCGLKYEGTLKQADKNNQGGVCDAAYYGLTADDYFGR